MAETPEKPTYSAAEFYDRQRRALGAKCQDMLGKAKVLICGMTGLGVEIAKNVILTGPHSVFLFDPEPVSYGDLCTNFYATEEHAAKKVNRVDAVFADLKELNPYVNVEKVTEKPTVDFMKQKGVTVFVPVNMPLAGLVELNAAIRPLGIKTVAASIRGLCGQLFVDAAIDFPIYDSNGVPPAENMVVDVCIVEPEPEKPPEPEPEKKPAEGDKKEGAGEGEKKEEPEEEKKPDPHEGLDQMLVSVYDDKINHGLGNGDKVVFSQVPGMPKLVDLGEIDIEPVGRHSFKIFLPDGVKHADVGVYEKGQMGYCKQVKGEIHITHQTLAEQLETPTCVEYDFGKLGYPARLHVLFKSLEQFMSSHDGELPKPYDEADATALFELAKVLDKDIDEEFSKKFAYTARGDLNPMAAFFGGFAAQEVQIVATGKFTPLKQFFYYDGFECLPVPMPKPEDCVFEPSDRYQGQVVVFGQAYQKKLCGLKCFLVGAGALGCEYLKNFALMGMCSKKEDGGVLHVTDMDIVEPSNLNRQFLFRAKHIQKLKSKSAAETVQKMNPKLNVNAYDIRVGPKTEDFFNQKFWSDLDVVVNALDNVMARLYVDSKIVIAKKPLVEAGTTGPQANCQIVVPNLTESYGDQRDPPEKRAPACTLKNFPYKITHCITWARDCFAKLFFNRPKDVNTYLEKGQEYLNELTGSSTAKLEVVKPMFTNMTKRPTTFHDCVEWARLRFADFFHNSIVQLLHSFPPGFVDPETKQPFWTGSKRCPKPSVFDFANPLHSEFLISGSNLCAEMFGIAKEGRKYDYAAALAKIVVPKFTPSDSVKVDLKEGEEEEGEGETEKKPVVEETSEDDEALADLLKKLPAPADALKMSVIKFEKDDDTNYHMDFITATSNNRGANYDIPPADKDKTKGIAGRIIPAMVTSTAMITGVGCLELYKVIQGEAKKKEDYKNTFMTLALPSFYQAEPADPKKVDADGSCTKWDAMNLSFGKDVTVRELIDYFAKEHKAVVDSIAYLGGMMYCDFLPGLNDDSRKDILVSEAAFKFVPEKKKPKKEAIAQMRDLYLTVLFAEDKLEVPIVAYQFQQF